MTGGVPALFAQSAKRRYDVVGAQSNGRHQADALARVQIDHAQYAKRRAIGELIVDEVHRPALIRRAGLHEDDTRCGPASAACAAASALRHGRAG